VESCLTNLTKLEDWNWLATAFEAKALLTNSPGALQTAFKFFSKNLNRKLLTECGFKLVHLSNDHKDFPLALQTMHQIFESNLDSTTVILELADICAKMGCKRKALLYKYNAFKNCPKQSLKTKIQANLNGFR
jgi:hypothetical protein